MKRPVALGLVASSALAALLLAILWPAGAATGRVPGTVLIVGDSLSTAYRIPTSSGWVSLLQQRLEAERRGYRVVNASVSGETTQRGSARLPDLLNEHRPDIVVVELGANDGLQRLPLEDMKRNLDAMISQAKTRGAKVLLVGVRLPPTYAGPYGERFRRVYHEIAAEQKVPLVPFILDGLVYDRPFFQEDRLHPTALAQPRLLENVWRKLETLLAAGEQAAVGDATGTALSVSAPDPAAVRVPVR